MIDVVGSDTQQSPEQAYLAVRTLCGLLRLRGFLWLALKLLPVQPVIPVSISGGPADTWAEGVSVVPHLEVPHSLESGLTALTTYKGPHSVWIEDWEIRALARPESELGDSTQILLAADHCQSVPANEACSVIPLLLLQASFIPDVIAAAAEDLLKTKGLLEVTEHMTIAFKLSLRNYQAVSSLCLLAMWIEEAKKKQWLHKAGKSPQTSPRLPQTEADLHMFCTNNFAMASSPMKELHVLAYHDIIRTLLQVESLGEDNKRSNQSLKSKQFYVAHRPASGAIQLGIAIPHKINWNSSAPVSNQQLFQEKTPVLCFMICDYGWVVSYIPSYTNPVW